MNRPLKPNATNTTIYIIIAIVVLFCCCCCISSLSGGFAWWGIGSSSASSANSSASSANSSASSANSSASSANSSTQTTRPPVQKTSNTLTNGCVKDWKYKKDKDSDNLSGPYSGCTKENSDKDWCMLPAYMSGGKENLAWKYTNNENDPDCLTDWKYYDKEGNIIESNISRTTMKNSGKRWCGLKVYVTGGPENKAWKYC